MSLPLRPPYPPMEALLVDRLPEGPEWQYEPKWDGFRCLAFRDGETVQLQSKSGQRLERYFPEMVEALLRVKASQFVLDGELAIPLNESLSFDNLLMRIHPAQSRVQKLAQEYPAMLVVFDLLVDASGQLLTEEPLEKRRAALEEFHSRFLRSSRSFRISPMTRDGSEATGWLNSLGESLDGVIAKRIDLRYQTGERTGMKKVKNIRSVDCVVGGFRYAAKGGQAGSMLLGLYDESGLLHHVGFTSSIKASEKEALTKKLENLRKPPGFTGRAPGGPSRWSSARSSEWEPLEPTLVMEVAYDHFTGDRFRHGAKFLRWRPDKAPKQCTFDQVRRKKERSELSLLEGNSG
jgi:ATP-dependent DNA ligase